MNSLDKMAYVTIAPHSVKSIEEPCSCHDIVPFENNSTIGPIQRQLTYILLIFHRKNTIPDKAISVKFSDNEIWHVDSCLNSDLHTEDPSQYKGLDNENNISDIKIDDNLVVIQNCLNFSNSTNITISLTDFKYVKSTTLNAQLFGLLIKNILLSKTFLINFSNWVKHRFFKKYTKELFLDCDKMMPLTLKVKLTFPKKCWMDILWGRKLCFLIVKQIQLSDVMNWLSTLGGAYSSLGNYSEDHAATAGQIAIQQLKFALEMGDPSTVIRCHLYFAHSLMQTGFLKDAKCIIKRRFSETKQLPVEDLQLRRMCQGLWTRLRYLYQKRKETSAGQKSRDAEAKQLQLDKSGCEG